MKTMFKAAALALASVSAVAIVPMVQAQAVQAGIGTASLDDAVARSNAAVLANNQINLTYKAQIDAAQAKANAYNSELAGMRTALETAAKAPNANQAALQQQADDLKAQQAQAGVTFSPTELEWLERIRDVIAASLTVSIDDLEDPPFAERGGIGGAYAVFADRLEPLLDELNNVLVA